MTKKYEKWGDIRRSKPMRRAEIGKQALEDVIEMNLKQVRELLGKTQTELAEASGSAQAQVSKIESGRDHLISTLRAHVEALGGELEVVARFENKTIKLVGV